MTVHEIAELAGVSIGTIDRVLHKRGRVSQETKARVESIIEQYQFTPNPIARRLKLNRSYRFYTYRKTGRTAFSSFCRNGIRTCSGTGRPW